MKIVPLYIVLHFQVYNYNYTKARLCCLTVFGSEKLLLEDKVMFYLVLTMFPMNFKRYSFHFGIDTVNDQLIILLFTLDQVQNQFVFRDRFVSEAFIL